MMAFEDTRNIRAALILEVLGHPPEHLTEALKELIEKIGNEEGVEVLSRKINEPVQMKDSKDFYTNFSEIEVEVNHVEKLVALIFKYMPAHVEVIQPELIALTNSSWTEFLSELVRRLHGYDEVARIIQNEKIILEKKLREMIEEKENVKIHKAGEENSDVEKANPVEGKE